MTNNGNDTFNVIATLRLRKGGKGNMIVTGVLDHTEFPPTFEGSFFSPSKLTQGIVLGKILPHARHVGITIRESARKGTRR